MHAHRAMSERRGRTRPKLRFGLEEVALEAGDTVVGRDEDSKITIDDDLVSRAHAVFRYDGLTVDVSDLQSRNGTFVNGVRIEHPTPLVHGDRVRIGPREILFTMADSSLPPSVRDHDEKDTGKLVECDACGEATPAESPACARCGHEPGSSDARR